mgnify:CR=1 FL=1
MRNLTIADIKLDHISDSHWPWEKVLKENIETFPSFRSTGVGKVFMDELKEYAKEKKFDMIDAWCEIPVAEYYIKMGFYKTEDIDHVDSEDIVRVEYKL